MQWSCPAHFRGTCLIGFNYYCLWSSLKRSKKGSVDNADPHGFLHTQCALSLVHACTQTDTNTHNPPDRVHWSTFSHTHITSPTVRLQIANQGDFIDLQTTERARDCKRGKGKSMFRNKHRVVSEGFLSYSSLLNTVQYTV